jgi:hypothetical protein
VAMITNFGLDISLGAFFKQASTSRRNFKKLLTIQLLPEYILIIIFALLGLALFPTLGAHLGSAYGLTTEMAGVMACLIFFEGTKKTLRMVLQLAFKSHQTALVEIATITSYLAMVWGGYSMGYPLSIPLIFVPMLITSAVSWAALIALVYNFYTTLPHHETCTITRSTHLRLLKNRLYNFLNQAGHMIFSSNFLVPFFAVLFGLEQAGVLKLVASIAYCITIILQKAFGLSGNVLLAHVKDEQNEQRQHAFITLSTYLNHALFAIAIFLLINHRVLATMTSLPTAGIAWPLLYLFFVINFSENFFIAYEKLFITQERTDLLLVFNGITLTLIAGTLYHHSLFSQLSLLCIVIGIRLLGFLAISILSFYQWRIKPTFKLNPSYALSSIAFSLIIFLLCNL